MIFIILYWGLQVLKYILYVTVCGTVGVWWFDSSSCSQNNHFSTENENDVKENIDIKTDKSLCQNGNIAYTRVKGDDDDEAGLKDKIENNSSNNNNNDNDDDDNNDKSIDDDGINQRTKANAFIIEETRYLNEPLSSVSIHTLFLYFVTMFDHIFTCYSSLLWCMHL